MNRLLVPVFVLALALAQCGGGQKTGARSGSGGPQETAQESEGEDGQDAPPAVPCETSDDCAKGQFCVDDECALPAPPGFY